MTPVRTLELLAVLATLGAMLFGAFNYMDSRHANVSDLWQAITEVRIETIEEDLDDDNTRLYYYDEEESEGPLTAREKLRREQLSKAVQAKTRKLERLETLQEQLEQGNKP